MHDSVTTPRADQRTGGLRNRILGLCLPPLLFVGLDAALTLAGQSADYWAGSYDVVREISPTPYHLLRIHPAAFAAGVLAWGAILVGIILLLPDTPALIVSIAVTFGHTVGAATWLLYRFQYGYQACNGLFLLSAVVLGLAIRLGWQAVPAAEYQLQRWPATLRWGLIAALFGIGVYLFLWPRTI